MTFNYTVVLKKIIIYKNFWHWTWSKCKIWVSGHTHRYRY